MGAIKAGASSATLRASTTPVARLYAGASLAWQRPDQRWSSIAPINAAIPGSPTLDAESAAIAAAIAAGTNKVMSTVEYALGVYTADTNTPRYDRSGVAPYFVDVPASSAWVPPPGSDGSIVVVDPKLCRHWCLWQYDPTGGPGGTPTWSGGGWADPTGSVVTAVQGTASGANFAWTAGLLTIAELVAGHIPHALTISVDIARVSDYRFPATRTDGLNLRGGGTTVMEGSRIQLDPTVNLSTIPAGYQRTIAAALQTYGAYVVDNGSSAVSVACEMVPGWTEGSGGGWYEFTHAGLASVGITGDYPSLAGIPWGSVRVLATWNGA